MARHTAEAVLVVLSGFFLACGESVPQAGRTASGIHFEIEGDGPSVVFAHAFSLDRRMWAREVAQLRPTHRVIRYDLRGHGLSDPWTEPFSAVQDLMDVFEAAEIERAIIVGLSLGAELALDFALAHPDRVAGLVLASPGLSGYQPLGSFDWMGPVMSELQAGYPEAAMQAWVDTPLMAITTDPAADSIMRGIALENWRIWSYDPGLQEAPERPAIGRLSEIIAPALILVGTEDFIDTRRVADTLAVCLTRAEFVTVEGAGHLLNLEAPEPFSDALRNFLQGDLGREEIEPRADC